MFTTIKFIRDALGIESTLAFVLFFFFAFGIAGGLAAWIVDKGYKKAQASQQRMVLPPNAASGSKTEKEKAEIIRQLSAFAEEGQQLLDHGKGMSVDWPKAKDWESRTERYIRQSVNETSAAYFSAETVDFAAPVHAVDRHYVDWIHTRQRRIGVIISQLQSG
jgi:hypothetical protein